MRVSRPLTVLFLLVVIAAASTAGALAWAAGDPDTGAIALTTASTALTYPAAVTLTAFASNPETSVAVLESLRADWKDRPGEEWVTVKSVQSPTNQFRFVNYPSDQIGYWYRVRIGSVVSTPAVFVPMRVLVSKPAATTTRVRAGRKVTFSGTIRPKHPIGSHSSDVRFLLEWQKQNLRTGRWLASSTTSISLAAAVDNDTVKWSYARSTLAREAGTHWRVRFVHVCPRHARSASPWTEYRIVR